MAGDQRQHQWRRDLPASLSPRQRLTPAPYAIYSLTASNLSGTLPALQLAGTIANSQLANNSITVATGAGLSGGGSVSLGGTTTLNNVGVITVVGNGDITATPSSGAVTLGSTATSLDTAGAIVKRDGGGNFAANSVTLNGVLNLPFPAAITSGGSNVFDRLRQPLSRHKSGL